MYAYKNNKMKTILYILLIGCFLTSCKVIETAVPDNFIEPYPALNNRVSAITIPVEIDLSSYLNAAEKEIPKYYSGKNQQCEGLSTSYTIKRENIKFSGSGNKIGYEVGGQLKLKLNYCPKCHTLTNEKGSCLIPRVYMSCGENEPMRKFNLLYSTAVNVNSDYSFKTATNLQKFELLDPCELTIANIDVTNDVEKEIIKQLKVLEQEIDKQFSSIDIKSIAKESWKLLQQPTEIPGYGYLSLAPSSLAISELKFSDKKARFNFNIDVSPSFTTEKPQLISSSLPNLSQNKADNGLNFGLDVILGYDSLSNFIRTSFKGEVFEIKRKKIIIEDIAVSGSTDNRIILKTTFSGSKRGVVYLLATPLLNDSLMQIELTNVDFDVKTKSVLLKSAKWFFNSKINQLVEEQGKFNYTTMLEDVKKEINSAFNQPLTEGVMMNGRINKIALNSIYYTTTHLVLRTQMTGSMKLILD